LYQSSFSIQYALLLQQCIVLWPLKGVVLALFFAVTGEGQAELGFCKLPRSVLQSPDSSMQLQPAL
jgi:hypothetical protein